MKKVLIVGTGAMATLFAVRLGQAGADVTLLGSWKNGIETLNRDGARLVEANGAETRVSVRATDQPADCAGADLALVTVKAWQTERVAGRLADCLSPDGLAVTLQNGLGNREKLAGRLGEARVALGVTTYGATLLGPGLARAGGDGLLSLEAHPRISGLETLLRGAGLRVDIVNDAKTLVWSKLVINAAINPLTALLRIPNGALLEKPAAKLLMAALAREAAKVARAHGIQLPFGDPASAAEDVARRTSSNRSSMFQDIKRGAPTEIDAICGAVVRAGQQQGIPAPVNWTMWRLVNALGG